VVRLLCQQLDICIVIVLRQNVDPSTTADVLGFPTVDKSFEFVLKTLCHCRLCQLVHRRFIIAVPFNLAANITRSIPHHFEIWLWQRLTITRELLTSCPAFDAQERTLQNQFCYFQEIMTIILATKGSFEQKTATCSFHPRDESFVRGAYWEPSKNCDHGLSCGC
jgi:hypothetical protein